MDKYIKETESICGLCKKIVEKDTMKKYIESYTWGSTSGSANYNNCCAECFATKINKRKEVKNRAYA